MRCPSVILRGISNKGRSRRTDGGAALWHLAKYRVVNGWMPNRASLKNGPAGPCRSVKFWTLSEVMCISHVKQTDPPPMGGRQGAGFLLSFDMIFLKR